MAYTEQEARTLVVEAGRRLLERGLVARTWGNISARISEHRFVITPSGLAYETMTPDQLVVVDGRDGSYEGALRPSSERGIHADAYRPEGRGELRHPHPPGHGQRLWRCRPGAGDGPSPAGGAVSPAPPTPFPPPGSCAGPWRPRCGPAPTARPFFSAATARCAWAGIWRTLSPSPPPWRRSAPGASPPPLVRRSSPPTFRTWGRAGGWETLSGCARGERSACAPSAARTGPPPFTPPSTALWTVLEPSCT